MENMMCFKYFMNTVLFKVMEKGFYTVNFDKCQVVESLVKKIVELQGDGNYDEVKNGLKVMA